MFDTCQAIYLAMAGRWQANKSGFKSGFIGKGKY